MQLGYVIENTTEKKKTQPFVIKMFTGVAEWWKSGQNQISLSMLLHTSWHRSWKLWEWSSLGNCFDSQTILQTSSERNV